MHELYLNQDSLECEKLNFQSLEKERERERERIIIKREIIKKNRHIRHIENGLGGITFRERERERERVNGEK